EKIILIVSSRGYKILLPILIGLNFFYKRDIFDFVIGGNRQNHLRKNKILQFLAKKVTKIYLESHSLVSEYKLMNFKNVEYLPNFKKLEIVNIESTDFNNIPTAPF